MKIYVRYASRLVAENHLTNAFSAFGEVAVCSLVRNEGGGEPIGLAIIEMKNRRDAVKAISQLDRVEIGGVRLRLDEHLTGVGRRTGDERRLGSRAPSERRAQARRSDLRLAEGLA